MDFFDNWQTPAATAIVVVTVVVFAVRIVRRRSSKNAGGCGTGCDCPDAGKPKVAKPGRSPDP